MVFRYVIKCIKCKHEIVGTYDTNKDVVNIKKCPFCSHEFPSYETVRLRDILDKISFADHGCNFTISEIQRKS